MSLSLKPWMTIKGVWCLAVSIAATCAALYLRSQVPIPIGDQTGDDVVYSRLASSLLNNDWLGVFDQNTLARGPSYPVFIAAMYAGHIPLKVGEELTYAIGCAAIACAVSVLTRDVVLATIGYVVLVMNPLNFSWDSAIVYRDNWQASMGMLTVGLMFLALCCVRRSPRRLALGVVLAVATGCVGAAYWLCREEGALLLPALAVVIVGVPLVAHRGRSSSRLQASALSIVRLWLPSAIVIAVAVGFGLIGVRAVMVHNEAAYGDGLTTDTASGAFVRMYSDWTRVDGGSKVAQVPISYQQRRTVYMLSPSAKELESYIEDPKFGWTSDRCPLHHCEIPGSLTIWVLRDAVEATGHYSSLTESQRFFEAIDADINMGCSSGRLACLPRLPSVAQSLTRIDAASLRSSASMVLQSLFSRDMYDPPSEMASGEKVLQRSGKVLVIRGLPSTEAQATEQLSEFKRNRGPYEALAAVYSVAVPAFLICTLIVTPWLLRRSKFPIAALGALSLALLTAAVVRCALWTVVSAADYPAWSGRYLQASLMYLLASGVVGCTMGIHKLRSANNHTTHGEPA